jgi:glutamate 5-kinase
VGVIAVEGEFERGDIIGVKSLSSKGVAWGISNYSASDTRLVMGKKSSEMPDILDHYFGREIVHRNNMALGVTPNIVATAEGVN